MLLLTLLHLLHDLLRSARRADWHNGRPNGHGRERLRLWLRLLIGIGIFIVAVARGTITGGFRRVAGLAGAEYDLPRRSLAEVPDHHHVVAGPLQELREHVARLARAVCAKNPFIGTQALDFCAGRG